MPLNIKNQTASIRLRKVRLELGNFTEPRAKVRARARLTRRKHRLILFLYVALVCWEVLHTPYETRSTLDQLFAPGLNPLGFTFDRPPDLARSATIRRQLHAGLAPQHHLASAETDLLLDSELRLNTLDLVPGATEIEHLGIDDDSHPDLQFLNLSPVDPSDETPEFDDIYGDDFVTPGGQMWSPLHLYQSWEDPTHELVVPEDIPLRYIWQGEDFYSPEHLYDDALENQDMYLVEEHLDLFNYLLPQVSGSVAPPWSECPPPPAPVEAPLYETLLEFELVNTRRYKRHQVPRKNDTFWWRYLWEYFFDQLLSPELHRLIGMEHCYISLTENGIYTTQLELRICSREPFDLRTFYRLQQLTRLYLHRRCYFTLKFTCLK